jgi:hypothetical protein
MFFYFAEGFRVSGIIGFCDLMAFFNTGTINEVKYTSYVADSGQWPRGIEDVWRLHIAELRDFG